MDSLCFLCCACFNALRSGKNNSKVIRRASEVGHASEADVYSRPKNGRLRSGQHAFVLAGTGWLILARHLKFLRGLLPPLDDVQSSNFTLKQRLLLHRTKPSFFPILFVFVIRQGSIQVSGRDRCFPGLPPPPPPVPHHHSAYTATRSSSLVSPRERSEESDDDVQVGANGISFFVFFFYSVLGHPCDCSFAVA